MRSFSARIGLIGLVAILGLLPTALVYGQTGKIAGRVTDAATGEPLPGVNVLIAGTTQGTSTDFDGYYTILNISPGTYAVRASFIGFTSQLVEGVRVSINQTTTVEFALQEEVVEGEEVVVTAQRPVVQPDVSASLANITAEQIEQLPVSSISSAVSLQAGIQQGSQGPLIRGSGADEVAFLVNGLSLRDERDNTPFTSIPLSSLEEVQVQTGGFNAEYGNVRSGIINVVTKEGPRDRYSADVIMRYSPPSQKHFGALASDPNSYWIRPYVDPAVAWIGTENGAWDAATQRQYPEFAGWIAESEQLLRDDDPTNDLTPEALQQAFLWQHRKTMEITDPDYNLDIGFGGPVPGISQQLGNLRFYASYRRDENMYLVPLSRDRYREQTGHVKVTTDFAPGMKLSVEGLIGDLTGTASDRSGQPGIFRSPFSIASQMDRVSFIDTRIYATDYWAPTRVKTNMLGAKFTHTLNDRTFYELRLGRFSSKYDTNPGRLRDTTAVVSFGGVGFDEGPFGFEPRPSSGVAGMRMGVGMSNARDTSRVTSWNFQGDITSQTNRFLQVKSGFELNLSNTEVNYGSFDAFLPSSNSWSRWDEVPVRGALYAQGKLEFKGLIANLGLRLDYFHAGGDWIDFESDTFSPFSPAFSAQLSGGLDTLLAQSSTDRIVTLSPRLGVSFPVTEFSKLYINYGHFRSMPDPNNLYLIRYFTETSQVARVADPNNPLPKTIAYELGYEHSLFNQFLIRMAGYYKNVALQPRLVNYVSRDGQTNYDISEPNSFEDIRGFEVTLARNRGRWVQGFINYTYMVYTDGYFGFRRVFENPTQQRLFELDQEEQRLASSRPVPQPYGRMNIDVLTPNDFGPQWASFRPLADWRLSFIGRWAAGSHFTWTGGGSVPGVENNVQFRDSWNLDLRLAKTFTLDRSRLQLFVDIFNVLNRRELSFTGFVDGNDYNDYMRSLHLEPDPTYAAFNIPGDDRPGEWRKSDVEFVPMQLVQARTDVNAPDLGTIYYERSTETYLEYQDGAWAPVDQGRLDQILEDKAYIDMPNMGFLSFLNPRDVYFGLRFTF